MPATPPPHRPAAATTDGRPAAKRPAAKRKSSKKSKSSGGVTSAWGCFWRSVVFTAALLALYVLFGMIMQLA